MIVRGVELNWFDLNRFMLEIHESQFMTEMRRRKLTDGSKSSMGQLDCSMLYALVRWFRPSLCVETGGNTGMASTFILKGMKDAQVEKPRLLSIDCATDVEFGAMIPADLQTAYEPIFGRSEVLLREGRLPERIDLFLHDSLHRRDHMAHEFAAFWPRLSKGGLLVSHDVNHNSAFTDFVSATYSHNDNGVADDATTHAYWGRVANLGFIVKA
jgi:predicted O-methyltransferase YrrM